MREAWQANIPRMWEERKVEVPAGAKPEELIKVPQNAQYFAALGAIEFGKGEDDCVGCYQGYDKLDPLHRLRAAGRKGQGRRVGPGEKRRRARYFPRAVPPQEVHPGHIPEGPDGRRVRRHRRRVDFHQSRAARRKRRHPLQVLPALERQSDPGHDRDVREPARPGGGAGREARSAGRGHHRLREGHSERCSEGGRRRWSKPSRTPNRR